MLFSTGTDGWLLCARWWTFRFRKLRGIYRIVERAVRFSRRTLLLGGSQSVSQINRRFQLAKTSFWKCPPERGGLCPSCSPLQLVRSHSASVPAWHVLRSATRRVGGRPAQGRKELCNFTDRPADSIDCVWSSRQTCSLINNWLFNTSHAPYTGLIIHFDWKHSEVDSKLLDCHCVMFRC
jgi:hypothetical protein